MKSKRIIFLRLRKNGYYYSILMVALMYPIMLYPRIYGVDTFTYIWMAQAIRNGALTSEKTWLIHPTSYFGYYPFSHTPIGVPLFLAFLISLIEFLTCSIYGLIEAILIFNILDNTIFFITKIIIMIMMMDYLS